MIDPAPAVGPDASGADVCARFEADSATLVIAVVDSDGRPIGLVERFAFFARMAGEYGRALFSHRPVSVFMEPLPPVIEAGRDLDDFRREAASDSSGLLLRGFIVVEGGRYLGVGTALTLLAVGPDRRPDQTRAPAAPQAHAPQARAALPSGRFLDRLGGEMTAALHGALAVAELLERQPLGGDAAAYVRTVADCNRTLLRLINDAAELDRLESGDLTLAPQPVRLRDLLDEVQAEWSGRALEDGVALGAVFGGEAGMMAELDGGRLAQIYHALIGHALDLTRRGGVEASLQAEPEGDRVRLRGQVRDTGPGVDPANLPGLFEPFSPAGRAPYGSGLRLAIAGQLVARMGGRIWAENNGGLGCTVFFELEAGVCVEPSQAPETAAEPQAPALAGRILVVDDNATNRTVARTIVEMFGCTCDTVEDGAQAVEAVRNGRYDAVLMDIRMPRMDGVEATQAIRALPGPASAVPILALTANVDPDDARTYRAAGMNGVIEKPIKPERLLLALVEALSGPAVDNRRAAA